MMSQITSETVSSTHSLSVSDFITLQPQSTPPLKPLTGCNIYSDGNNNLAWKNAQGNVATLSVMSNTASRVYTLPNQSGELVTLDSLSLKEDKSKKGQPLGYPSLDEEGKVPSTQLPNSVSGFTPSVVCVLYAVCEITPGNAAEAVNLTTVPPTVFSSLVGFEPNVASDLTVDTLLGDFTMDTVGSVYEFKIDTYWQQDANSGERRLVSLIPINGDLQSDQVTRREELGLISSSYGQTISCNGFVHVNNLGASGGFCAGLELVSPNATTNRTVDVRIRVIRWN